MIKAALHNLGCKVNAYETEAMQQLLEDAGYEIVPFGERADVYIINTCSVTNVADKKSRQMLHRAKKLNPDAVVVAAGCYVQAAGDVLEDDGKVDLIIGNNKKKDLVRLLERYFKDHKRTEEIIDIGASREYEALHIKKLADHTRAFIKVQDGCNQFCSYCIIPYTRGRVRSRSMEDILKEVTLLTENGCREIVLTGIHLSSYGADSHGEGEQPLLELIRRLDRAEGINRIRLGSLEPRIMTEDFVKALSEIKSVCPHFHLSLQSGCDATLLRMNRRYTTGEYLEGCERLRRYFDHPAITTDVIVGFPGETEAEFEETKAFLRKIRFYEMHIFKYSRRAGTKAADMERQVPDPVKAERSEELLTLGRELSREYRESFLGRCTQVLLEEREEHNGTAYMTGYTREYVKAAVPFREGLKNTLVTGILEAGPSGELLYLRALNEI